MSKRGNSEVKKRMAASAKSPASTTMKKQRQQSANSKKTATFKKTLKSRDHSLKESSQMQTLLEDGTLSMSGVTSETKPPLVLKERYDR